MAIRNAVRYSSIYHYIVSKLKNGLSPRFTYHSIDHTLDVLEQAQQIARREAIQNEEDLFLLQVAALYHDNGFLFVYSGHEEKSCELAQQELPGFGLSPEQIHTICGMIMATKIPQSPVSLLEKIICDADLDYLGRDDFDPISQELYKEFLDFGFVKDYNDWMQKQIRFFESHQYFTGSSQQLRGPEKMKHLEKLKTYSFPGNP